MRSPAGALSTARQTGLAHALGALARPLDELAAVRADEVSFGYGRQTRTSPKSSPSSSSLSTTDWALSSGETPSVLTTSCGLVGASYGSETPVNSLISPEKAFS